MYHNWYELRDLGQDRLNERIQQAEAWRKAERIAQGEVQTSPLQNLISRLTNGAQNQNKPLEPAFVNTNKR
jgi:hypothetical protein